MLLSITVYCKTYSSVPFYVEAKNTKFGYGAFAPSVPILIFIAFISCWPNLRQRDLSGSLFFVCRLFYHWQVFLPVFNNYPKVYHKQNNR